MARKRQARRCRANRTDGRPCGAWAMNGAFTCVAHGSATPRARHAAYLREFERRLLAEFNREYDRWQRELLEWHANRIVTAARLLGKPVEEIEPWDIVWSHHLRGRPPLSDEAPKLRRDRRFRLPQPPVIKRGS